MKKLFTGIVYTLAIALGLLLAAGLSLSRLDAQEITPEPAVEAVSPIVVEDGGTLIQEAPDTPLDTSALFGLGAALFVAIASGGGALLVLNRVLNSKAAKDNTEKLYEGLSPTWQSTIERIIDVAEQINRNATDVLRFARESTDGLPNAETPPTGTTVPRPTTTTTIGGAPSVLLPYTPPKRD